MLLLDHAVKKNLIATRLLEIDLAGQRMTQITPTEPVPAEDANFLHNGNSAGMPEIRLKNGIFRYFLGLQANQYGRKRLLKI